jgi:hypothetical protein
MTARSRYYARLCREHFDELAGDQESPPPTAADAAGNDADTSAMTEETAVPQSGQ